MGCRAGNFLLGRGWWGQRRVKRLSGVHPLIQMLGDQSGRGRWFNNYGSLCRSYVCNMRYVVGECLCEHECGILNNMRVHMS